MHPIFSLASRIEDTRRAATTAELMRCITMYERLASPPRHLQYPRVQSLHATITLHDRAVQRGDARRANELAELCQLEYARRDALERWPGRSLKAWRAAADRMTAAMQEALTMGIIGRGGASHQALKDRIADANLRALDASYRESMAAFRAADTAKLRRD